MDSPVDHFGAERARRAIAGMRPDRAADVTAACYRPVCTVTGDSRSSSVASAIPAPMTIAVIASATNQARFRPVLTSAGSSYSAADTNGFMPPLLQPLLEGTHDSCQSACAIVGRARKSVSWAWLSPTRKYCRGDLTVPSFPPSSPNLPDAAGLVLDGFERPPDWDIGMRRHGAPVLLNRLLWLPWQMSMPSNGGPSTK